MMRNGRKYGGVATPEGIEPSTCRLEVGCSIQLSYGAASFGDSGRREQDKGRFSVAVRVLDPGGPAVCVRLERGLKPGPSRAVPGAAGRPDRPLNSRRAGKIPPVRPAPFGIACFWVMPFMTLHALRCLFNDQAFAMPPDLLPAHFA